MATRLNEDFNEWKKKKAIRAGSSNTKGKLKRNHIKEGFLDNDDDEYVEDALSIAGDEEETSELDNDTEEIIGDDAVDIEDDGVTKSQDDIMGGLKDVIASLNTTVQSLADKLDNQNTEEDNEEDSEENEFDDLDLSDDEDEDDSDEYDSDEDEDDSDDVDSDVDDSDEDDDDSDEDDSDEDEEVKDFEGDDESDDTKTEAYNRNMKIGKLLNSNTGSLIGLIESGKLWKLDEPILTVCRAKILQRIEEEKKIFRSKVLELAESENDE